MWQRLLITFLLVIGISVDVYAQDDKKIYEQAGSSFTKGNFEEAQQLYQKYLDFYPQGEKVSDVQFKLAECAFQLRAFSDAAARYEKVGDLYPTLDVAKQALARAGECFQKMGDDANAKRVFNKLKDRYPDTPDAEYAKYNLTQLEKSLPGSPTTIKQEKKPKQSVAEQPLTEEEVLQKAKKAFTDKDYQQAVDLFRDFLKRFKTSNFADYSQVKIAECLYYQNKYQDALKEYKKVMTDYPQSKYIDYALYSIGWCHYRLDNYADAIASFEKLVKESPNSKYFASSQNAIEKIKTKSKEKEAKKLLAKAKSFYTDKKYKEAKNNINELLNKYPESETINEAKEILAKIDAILVASSYKEARTIYDRGEKALENKNTDEAIHEFKRVIAEFPESEYAKLAEKAIALIDQEKAYLIAKKKWEESVQLYEAQKVEEAKKGFKEIVTQYPETKYKEKAEEKLVEVETKEKELNAYETYKKGLALMQKKDYQEAINTFEKVLLNYPETEYSSLAEGGIKEAKEASKNELLKRKFDIAQRYYQLGDYKSAKELFEEIKSASPETEYGKKANENLVAISKVGTPKGVEEEYNFALSLYEKGNLQESMAQFKKIIDKYPDTKFAKAASESLITTQKKLTDTKAKNLYDDAHRSQEYGEYTDAITKYDKLISECPDSYWTPYATYGKAETLYAMEDFTKARVEWEKVVNNFSNSDLVPHALYHVAECYEQTGDYKKAYLSYDKLQKTYPKSIYGEGELAELIKDKMVVLKEK